MTKRSRFGVFCLALSLACCWATRATTLERMSVARISRVAKLIIRARCISNSTRWDAGEIWTFTSFEVGETWKGAPPERITVRLLGGTLGALTSTVSGVPRFRPGEEVILFLQPTSRGDFSVVSWEQGTFRIRSGSAGRASEETVTQDTAALATFDPQSRRFKAIGLRNVPLPAFRAQVESALSRLKEKRNP